MHHGQSRLLRFADLKSLVGLSRTSIARLERAGEFPKRRRISTRAIAWLKSDVDAWLASRRIAS